MEKVNVLVASRQALGEEFFSAIASVDPRISVADATRQVVAELRRDGVSGSILAQIEAEVKKKEGKGRPWYETEEDLDALLKKAEVITGVLLPRNLSSRAPRLKWVHLMSAGLDHVDRLDLIKAKVMVTNNSGTLSLPIAEHALALIFMLAKGAPRLFEDKQNRRWQRFDTLDIVGKTVGVIGLGHIGKEVARLAKGVGMRVIATRRTATARQSSVEGVDELFPKDELPELLHQSDFVVLAVPLTSETRKMIGERELRTMKPSAFVVNVCRGQVIDEPVLIRALRDGWIAGAGLDVVASEPLSRESPLWDLPNVILSPHKGAWTEGRPRRMAQLLRENLKRYLAGQKLINLMEDVERGY